MNCTTQEIYGEFLEPDFQLADRLVVDELPDITSVPWRERYGLGQPLDEPILLLDNGR